MAIEVGFFVLRRVLAGTPDGVVVVIWSRLSQTVYSRPFHGVALGRRRRSILGVLTEYVDCLIREHETLDEYFALRGGGKAGMGECVNSIRFWHYLVL